MRPANIAEQTAANEFLTALQDCFPGVAFELNPPQPFRSFLFIIAEASNLLHFGLRLRISMSNISAEIIRMVFDAINLNVKFNQFYEKKSLEFTSENLFLENNSSQPLTEITAFLKKNKVMLKSYFLIKKREKLALTRIFSKETGSYLRHLDLGKISTKYTILRGILRSGDLICSITEEIPRIPVRLNGRLYELHTLLTIPTQKDPYTRQPFSWTDIEPAEDIIEELNSILDRVESASKKSKLQNIDSFLNRTKTLLLASSSENERKFLKKLHEFLSLEKLVAHAVFGINALSIILDDFNLKELLASRGICFLLFGQENALPRLIKDLYQALGADIDMLQLGRLPNHGEYEISFGGGSDIELRLLHSELKKLGLEDIILRPVTKGITLTNTI